MYLLTALLDTLTVLLEYISLYQYFSKCVPLRLDGKSTLGYATGQGNH